MHWDWDSWNKNNRKWEWDLNLSNTGWDCGVWAGIRKKTMYWEMGPPPSLSGPSCDACDRCYGFNVLRNVYPIRTKLKALFKLVNIMKTLWCFILFGSASIYSRDIYTSINWDPRNPMWVFGFCVVAYGFRRGFSEYPQQSCLSLFLGIRIRISRSYFIVRSLKPHESVCFNVERRSSFCSVRRLFLQNEDPIDFIVLVSNKLFGKGLRFIDSSLF